MTKNFWLLNALPIVCIICATVLALNNISGWGWLVFVAVISGVRDDKEDFE